MSVDPTSSEGYIGLDKLNYYAETEEKKGVAFWWLLPVEVMCNFEEALSRLMRLEVAHYLIKMTQELAENISYYCINLKSKPKP